MKHLSKNWFKLIASLIFLITIFIVQACGDKSKTEDKGKDLTSFTDTITVEAQNISTKELAISKTFSASLEGEEQANVIAKIPETIVKIRVKVGDFVKAGSVLFELDKSGASSMFYQAQAAFLNAQKDYERMQNLLKEGAVSQQAFDGVQTLYEVSKANFDAARSMVEITSPISGIVTAINVNLGDLANPQMPMGTVANIGNMKAKFNVGEADVPSLYSGQLTQVYSELNPDLIKNGKIYQISRSANIQSRTFEVQTIFQNTPDKWFKPGMFCKVNINMKSKKDALVLPMNAIVKSNNSEGVFIINDGKSYYKNITTGLNDGNEVEVVSGLKVGDKVVTLGTNNLKDGTVVVVSNK
jgi:membrane fusion protein, multidrug efflux system